jgi:DNA replication protein DnaC
MKRVGDLVDSATGQHEAGARGSRVKRAARPTRQTGPEPRSGAQETTVQDDVCPICKGKGFLVYDVPPGHPDFNKAVACRCTQARVAAEQINKLRTVSNLGALERMTFDSFLPDGVALPEALRRDLRKVYELCLSFATNPAGWLVLFGGYGAGKTHLAAAIANHQVALGRTVLFVVVPDLLDHLRAAYAPSSETGLDERLEAIREAPLLILDDLGAHNSTPWAQEKLFQIVNHRYNSQLPTVITTNQRLEELDPRIASRLVDLDLSQVVNIPAPDFRAGQAGITMAERGGRNLSTLALHDVETFDAFSLRAAELQPDQRENLRQAVALAKAFAKLPTGWLVFTGTYGCGKTHLAAAIANYQIAAGLPTPMFIVVPDLLDHLRATFSPSSGTTLDRVFEQVRTTSLLILDDLGTESATPWAREKLFQLLNHRYAARLPTVITTYNTLDEIDERLASRMRDTSRCTVHGITAPSYRGSEARQVAKRAERKPRS